MSYGDKKNFLKAFDQIFPLFSEDGQDEGSPLTGFGRYGGRCYVKYTIDGEEYETEINVNNSKENVKLYSFFKAHMDIKNNLYKGLKMLGIKNFHKYETFSFRRFKRTVGEILWLKYLANEKVLDKLSLYDLATEYTVCVKYCKDKSRYKERTYFIYKNSPEDILNTNERAVIDPEKVHPVRLESYDTYGIESDSESDFDSDTKYIEEYIKNNFIIR